MRKEERKTRLLQSLAFVYGNNPREYIGLLATYLKLLGSPIDPECPPRLLAPAVLARTVKVLKENGYPVPDREGDARA